MGGSWTSEGVEAYATPPCVPPGSAARGSRRAGGFGADELRRGLPLYRGGGRLRQCLRGVSELQRLQRLQRARPVQLIRPVWLVRPIRLHWTVRPVRLL